MSFIENLFSLTNQTVVITGGGGMISRAIARVLLELGAKVSLWGRTDKSLQEAKNLLEDQTGLAVNIHTFVVDTTDETAIRAALPEVEKNFAVPDALINGVGGNRGKTPFIETDLQLFEDILKMNLIAGLMAPTKIIAKYWINKKIKGTIINLASMSSYLPLSGVWAYNAAKAGILNLTQAAAKEFAPYGIRVNAIAPGFFIGKQNRNLLLKNDGSGDLTERGKMIIDHTPFGRFGEVDELGGTAAFLLSQKAAGFITGICIPVDGGYLIDNI
ncbi:MAG: SDR family oxidoreductase [Spirochaetes bacterium]|nr:SDR family oxidoreductase [Spirochaetota bacterium]